MTPKNQPAEKPDAYQQKCIDLFEKYMQYLQLFGWEQEIQFLDDTGMGDRMGGIDSYPGAKFVRLYLHRDEDAYSEEPMSRHGLETTIAHECVHLLFHDVGLYLVEESLPKKFLKPFDVWHEAICDRLARVIVHEAK